jgi:DNA-binding transcriptional regulator WhiA
MRKYNLNENFFDKLTEKSSYWLGFLYADGYVRMKDGKSGELKLKLKDTDKNHIEKFLKDIECKKPIKCGVDGKSKFCSVTVYSNLLVNKLFDLGCVNNKTQKIRLPKLSEPFMSHFIRGYFDGDGSIHKIKNRPNSFSVSICSNNEFNDNIIDFLGYGKPYKYKNYSVIKISKIMDILNFKNYIYSNAVTLLERKLIKFEQIKE